MKLNPIAVWGLGLAVAISPSSASGQQREFGQSEPEVQVPIVVEHTGDDAVGQQLAFELHEAIRRSAGYRLVEAETGDDALRIHLVTLDPNAGRTAAGASTVASVVYTTGLLDGQKFLGTGVYIAGHDRLATQARSILATADQQASDQWQLAASMIRQSQNSAMDRLLYGEQPGPCHKDRLASASFFVTETCKRSKP